MSDNKPHQLNDLMHRLRSLEVDLHEAARSRELSQASYSTRLERLRYAIQYAAKIKAMIAAPEQRIHKVSQVDLPVLTDCSRMEQKVIAKFVAGTRDHVADIARKTDQAADWSRDAANLETGWFKGVRRLSWLRMQISRTEQNIEMIRRARAAVEDFVSRSELAKPGENSVNQRDLVSAFREFEMATDRVTALRARVRSETTRNNDMRNWLVQNSAIRRQQNPEKAPPEPKDVSAMTASVFNRLTGGAKVANDRLVVARQLFKALKRSEPASDVESTKSGTESVAGSSADEIADRVSAREVSGRKQTETAKLSRKAKKKIKESRL